MPSIVSFRLKSLVLAEEPLHLVGGAALAELRVAVVHPEDAGDARQELEVGRLRLVVRQEEDDYTHGASVESSVVVQRALLASAFVVDDRNRARDARHGGVAPVRNGDSEVEARRGRLLALQDEAKKVFAPVMDNTATLLIVSQIEFKDGDEFKAMVSPAEGCTCARCRMIVPFVTVDELCPRCDKIVNNK